MGRRVLITGGAGFIGSHVADELLAEGYEVRALDSMAVQVHGALASRPEYLDPNVELIVGDVRDPEMVRAALDGVDAVLHFAAVVGVGQSMYEIERYTSINDVGTAVLLEAVNDMPVERLVVASSMSIYGEGLCSGANGTPVTPPDRSLEQLRAGRWELMDENGSALTPCPTPETKEPSLASVYALTKYDQERLCLMFGRAYDIDTVALRFFNVYGPRQALSNPYTGVLAIFASRLLNGRPPLIFEDGNQKRDFVSVHDVSRACRLALEVPDAAGKVFNVGSGRNYTVREIAEKAAAVLGAHDVEPEVTGKYRMGDIRHCFADISRARSVLGYDPQISLSEGLEELAGWLEGRVADDYVDAASEELTARGLTV